MVIYHFEAAKAGGALRPFTQSSNVAVTKPLHRLGMSIRRVIEFWGVSTRRDKIAHPTARLRRLICTNQQKSVGGSSAASPITSVEPTGEPFAVRSTNSR